MKTVELARKIGAVLEGDPELTVTGLASPDAATPDDLVVVFQGANVTGETQARAAVVPHGFRLPNVEALLHVDEPRVALATLSAMFARQPRRVDGIHPQASVSPDAELGDGVSIGPFCVVEAGAEIGAGSTLVAGVYVGEDARVGADNRLHPGVVLYPDTVLGDRVEIHANASIGLDGFSFVTEQRDHPKVHSLGHVIVGDDVEIGSHSGIQRGTLGPTRIGRGTKIGVQVEIGHNGRIGDYCLLAGKIGIAGTVVIGSRVVIAVGVTIRDHVTIGDGASLMMGCTVTRDVPEGATVLGAPAQDHRAEKARHRALTKLAVHADALLQKLRPPT